MLHTCILYLFNINMKFYDEENILKLLNIVIDSGKEILKVYNNEIFVNSKEDKSPITQADINSNNLIISRLKKLEPNIPILSEESLVEWENRKDWNKYWLIDPLDGTKEFINRNGEFTVNISLIENHCPIFGIIYSPVKSLLYYAFKNNGSYKLKTNTNLASLDNFNKININKEKNSTTKIIGSRSHSSKEFQKWVKNNFTDFEIITIGSSLKFCILAEGGADIYPRLGPTSEWDVAAGHIILEEAGGKLKSIDNKDILYNTKEDILNPHFIAYANIPKID